MAKLVQYMVTRNDSEFVNLPTKANHVPMHLNVNISLKVFNLKKMERMLFPTRDEDFKRRLLKG